MSDFFTQAFGSLGPEELERYHRAVFMNMEGEFAAAKRVEYYRGLLRQMGQGVTIGL